MIRSFIFSGNNNNKKREQLEPPQEAAKEPILRSSLFLFFFFYTICKQHKTLSMEKPKSCQTADRNPRCKPCTSRRKGGRCEYLPAKKRSAAEEEFSASSIDPERNIVVVDVKRKNRKVDRFNPGQSSLRNQATE